MSISRKLSQTATGGAGEYVEDVFSTYLYTGNGSTQTITNDINLADEGGLVWLKNRDAATNHRLYTTDLYSGSNSNLLQTNLTTGGGNTGAFELESFNSNGFTLGYSGGAYSESNGANTDYASWTFRKAPGFFDVVTYTGTGFTEPDIPHNLGVKPACYIIKRTDSTGDWFVYHKSLATSEMLVLNTTAAATGNNMFGAVPTATTFKPGGDADILNATYVAYLFAHNDGDGEFGENGDQDIIKCGSYTGTGGTQEITLGFEPQWVLIKKVDSALDWIMFDVMRGWTSEPGVDQELKPNLSDKEIYSQSYGASPVATGIELTGTNNYTNASGGTYIYIAIRRPMKAPETGSEVFAIDTQVTGAPNVTAGFVVDAATRTLTTGSTSYPQLSSRLTGGQFLITSSTASEVALASWQWDYMDGYGDNIGGTSTTLVSHMWKRAPGFFDVVAYTGDGIAGRTVNHNLGVAPELLIVKSRSFAGTDWLVLDTLNTQMLKLQTTDAAITDINIIDNYFGNGATVILPTNSNFTVSSNLYVNSSGAPYIAYLFASLDGISKVFSVTKSSGSDASVDCGFSAGPRFVMLKRTDSTGDWYIWDTERGIVAGNDPYLLLNTTAAEVTSTDYIDPTSNGFTIVNGGLADGDYIGYAVA